MGVATMLLVWFLARRMFGDSAGLRAGMVFAACPLALALAREVIFDMTLTFFVTLAMVAFWLAEESDFLAPWFDALMFAAMGVAVITKGFVGILIPLIAILIYEVARGRWREWLRLRWGWGLLVFLAVALPWFIAVSVRNPDFPRYAFWNESLKRFTTGAAHRGGGILYYLPVFLGGFFPWSLFLLLAGWNRLRRWRELKQEAGRPILFLLCWAAWVFCLLHAFAFQASRLFSARRRSAEHPDGTGLAGCGQGGASAPAGLADGRICAAAGTGSRGGRRVAFLALRHASGAAGQEAPPPCVGTHPAVAALHRADPRGAGISRPEAGGADARADAGNRHICAGGRDCSQPSCCAGMRR